MTDPDRPPNPPPSAHADRHGHLSRAVRATSLVTFGSRIGGLVRDVVVGRMFGTGLVGSAFQAAFAIPNMFRRLFGEGALSAAFIPAYTDASKHSREEADRLASLTMTALGLVTTALTVVIELVLWGVLVLAPRDPERDLSIRLVMVMLPFMPLICAVAIQAAMLQVHGRYGPAASGPFILNTFIVATGLYFILTGRPGGETVAYILGIATVLSGVTQCCWFAGLLRRQFAWNSAWSSVRPRAAIMLRRFIPVAIGLGTLQLNTFLDTVIAMWPIWFPGPLGPDGVRGPATMFGLAYPLDASSNVLLALTARLYQFPLGVFGVAIASAAFPLLARHAKEPDHFTDTLRRALRLALFVGVPATVGMSLIGPDAIGVLYGHGRLGWTGASIVRASAVLTGFSIGIWGYSLNQVLTRAFYAQGDTRTPMTVSLAMIAINVVLNLSLIWIPGVRESGLAWSTAISAMLQALVLGILCTRMLRRVGAHEPMLDAHATGATAKVLVASAIMGGLVWTLLRLLPTASPLVSPTIPRALASDWAWQVVRVALGTGVGGVAYLALSNLLRMAEMKWLFHRAVREPTPPPA
ncbi:MAG TPA: murein biosynthesis integral membrane protein MurJ [Phycisphaerales bacterium]|nr:murein biosynthesis integral membrane protein MurJ [Phycisphaerales bacterium]